MQLHLKTRCKRQTYRPPNEVMIVVCFTNFDQWTRIICRIFESGPHTSNSTCDLMQLLTNVHPNAWWQHQTPDSQLQVNCNKRVLLDHNLWAHNAQVRWKQVQALMAWYQAKPETAKLKKLNYWMLFSQTKAYRFRLTKIFSVKL